MRVLVVDEQPPQPTRDGASLRMWSLLEVLVASGREIALASIAPWPDRIPHPAGVEVVARDGDVEAHLAADGSRYDAVILSRVVVAAPLAPVVREHAPGARLVFDTMDLRHLQLYRMAKALGNASLVRQSIAAKAAELRLTAECDATLAVTERERDVLLAAVPGANVQLVSTIHDVLADTPGPEARSGGVLIAHYGHLPNVLAARELAERTWPLDGIPLTIVGAPVPDELARLDEPWLHVAGYVRDIEPVLARARVALAPLKTGAGVKVKVLLAMAHGVPVVASSIGAEGLPVLDGEHLLIADTPAETAAAVRRLHEDDDLWQRLADAGRRVVEEHFSTDAALRGLDAALAPSVGVVVPVFNGAALLPRALRSVAAQGIAVDLVVVDDGSTDGSAGVAEREGARVVRLPGNSGAGAARNAGAAAVRGELIAFLDADDEWLPGRLAAGLRAFADDPGLDVCFAHLRPVRDGVARPPQPGPLPSTMLVRRAAFERFGGFGDVRAGEIAAWISRARAGGVRERMLDDVVLHRHAHGSNLTADRERMKDWTRVLKDHLDRRRAEDAA